MGKAILFLRVSTLTQQLESQELVARRTAHADGYTDDDILPPIKYKESAVKLKEKDREGLQDLYKTLEARNDIDAIYVTELSRLSRQAGVLYSIRDYLLEKKVQLVCGSPAFRLLDKKNKLDKTASLVFAIFGCFAEQEAIEKKERFARGKEQKAIENKFSGGNIPFGYRVDKERENLIVIDPKDAAMVKEVFNLYESGITQPKLAREYHRRGVTNLTISFINNILNNERYTGSRKVYKGSSYPRSYPMIITPEQFERCRAIALENNTKAGKARNVYYASKLIVCSQCGCYWTASGSKCFYRCYDAHNPMRKYDHYKTPQCTNKSEISINVLDSLLWYIAQKAEVDYILNAASKDKEKYEERINDLSLKLENIDGRLFELDNKRGRIVESYIEGHISKEDRDRRFNVINESRKEILHEQSEFLNEKEHLEALLVDIKGNYGLTDVDGIVADLEKIMALQQRIKDVKDDNARSEIVHRHIQKITVENTEIEFEFGIGRKLAKARFIIIQLYRGETQYYYYIPNSGLAGVVIRSDADGNQIERIYYEYLDRYHDEGKRRRHREARERSQRETKEKYPEDKYFLGYTRLAEYLHVAVSTAERWVVEKEVLKPAVIGKHKKLVVIDKAKCMELLRIEAEKNAWLKKILDKMHDEQDTEVV